MEYTIGVDYGMNTGDLSSFAIVGKEYGKTHIIECGLIEDLNYEVYRNKNVHIVAAVPGDVERFKAQFNI
jgi:hypothetical protein